MAAADESGQRLPVGKLYIRTVLSDIIDQVCRNQHCDPSVLRLDQIHDVYQGAFVLWLPWGIHESIGE